MSPRTNLRLLPLLSLVMAGLTMAKVASPGEHQSHHMESPGPPYLGSYQVEDSCQFVVCGQDFSQEFGPGLRPSEGSCSGECDQLASSLVTNRFSREFLWASCSRMCADKYTFQLFRSGQSLVSHVKPPIDFIFYSYFQTMFVLYVTVTLSDRLSVQYKSP